MGIEMPCSQGLRITWLVGVRAGSGSLPTISASWTPPSETVEAGPEYIIPLEGLGKTWDIPIVSFSSPPRFQIYLFIHFIPLFIHLLLGAQINFLANPVFFNLKSYVSFCCCFFIGGYLIYNVELVSDVQQSDLVIHIAILFRYFSYIGYYGVSSLSCTVYPCRLTVWYITVQFSSVAQSCPTLCDPINCSTPGLPVHHQLPEFTQTHVHRVSDAIQPSHPLLSPSPPARNPSQHQSLFQ